MVEVDLTHSANLERPGEIVIWQRMGRVEIHDTDASGLIFYGAPTQWFAVAEQDHPLETFEVRASSSTEHLRLL